MTPLSIIGLFCEDIREESGGMLTLNGLMTDNINVELIEPKDGANVSSQNRFFDKLCIFVRANFDPDDPIKEIKLALAFPDDKEISVGEALSDTIARAKDETRERGLPLCGVVIRCILVGFRMHRSGVVRLVATINGEKRALAALNFRVGDPPTSPTAS